MNCYKVKTIRAGNTKTFRAYRARPKNKGKRSPKTDPTPEAQKKNNLARATWTLTWLLNENFCDGDLLITLKYQKGKAPEDSEQMNRDARNFLDKINRRYKKLTGKRIRYVRVMEIGKRGARHHHIVMQEVDSRILRECWGKGGIDIKPLYTDGNYRRIAEYFVKYAQTAEEIQRREMKKLWYASKGMKRPKESKGRKMSERKALEIRVPDGYVLDEDSVRRGISQYDGCETLIYLCVRLERRRNDKGKNLHRDHGPRSETAKR